MKTLGHTRGKGAAGHISSVPQAWVIGKPGPSLDIDRVYETNQLHLGALPPLFGHGTDGFWQLRLLEENLFTECHQACFVPKLRLSLSGGGSNSFLSHSKVITY